MSLGKMRPTTYLIHEMRAQTDRLMTLVCESRPSMEPRLVKLLKGVPQVKLVPLIEQEDIQGYLEDHTGV